jgi:glycosyltransferase involved in cell wall biosynthesis
VYVELFKHKQGARLYGAFGVTAIEAALTGRPVITMCSNYQYTYGAKGFDYDGLYLIETEEQLECEIQKFVQMSDDTLNRASVMSRRAALEAFSAERISKALIKAIK